MKNLITLSFLSILISCGQSEITTSTPGTSTDPNTQTITTTSQVWDTLEKLEAGLQAMTLSVTSSNRRLYVQSQEDGLQAMEFSVASDSFNVDIYELNDLDPIDEQSISKQEIIELILNQDNQYYGRSRLVTVEQCNQAAKVSASGQYSLIKAYKVIHQLEDGEYVVHVVSPDVALHANPLKTIKSSSEEVWIFTAQTFGDQRIVEQIGNDFISIPCI